MNEVVMVVLIFLTIMALGLIILILKALLKPSTQSQVLFMTFPAIIALLFLNLILKSVL